MQFNKPLKYKDLCAELGEKPKHGGYIQIQLNSFRQKYEIEKVDRKYIIKKELTEIEQIESMKYLKKKAYIEPMIYTLLTTSETNILRVDMRTLMLILKVVNQDYYYAKYHTEEVDTKLMGMDTNGLKTFMSETEPMYKRIIREVLFDMADQQLIQVNQIPIFAKRYKGENNKCYTKTYEADKDIDIPKLLEAKRSVLKKFNLTQWSELNWYQLNDAKRMVAKELEIDYFYQDYEIILNKVGLNELYVENLSELQDSFNKYIQARTLNSQAKGMRLLTKDETKVYVDALVNIDNDMKLRERK